MKLLNQLTISDQEYLRSVNYLAAMWILQWKIKRQPANCHYLIGCLIRKSTLPNRPCRHYLSSTFPGLLSATDSINIAAERIISSGITNNHTYSEDVDIREEILPLLWVDINHKNLNNWPYSISFYRVLVSFILTLSHFHKSTCGKHQLINSVITVASGHSIIRFFQNNSILFINGW